MDSCIGRANNRTAIVLLIALSLVPARALRAEDCGGGPLELRKSEVLRQIDTRDVSNRLRRREDLEDDLLQVVPKRPDSLQSPVLLYETQERRFAVDRGEVVLRTCNDGCNTRRYVGIPRTGLRVYHLFGFPDAIREFNEMAADSGVRVANRTDAEAYAGLCMQVAYGIEPDRWVVSGSVARILAARYFWGSDAQHGPASADKWWRSVSSGQHPADLQIRTTEAPAGSFLVSVPVFSISAGRPEIRAFQLVIGKGGACHTVPVPASGKAE